MSKRKEIEEGELSSSDEGDIIVLDDSDQEPARKIQKRTESVESLKDDFTTNNLLKNSDSTKDQNEEDDDILELFSTTRVVNKNKKRDSYYDNDYLVDINEVKKRWNIKTLADPKANMSLSNYRSRLYGEKKENVPKRTMRPGIFCEETNEGRENNLEEDEKDFHRQLDHVRAKLVKQKEECKRVYNQKLAKLNQIHETEQIKILTNTLCGSIEQIGQTQVANSFYNVAVQNLDFNYHQKIKSISDFFQNEEDALFALFNSKSFKKGKLNQYTAFDVFQPTSSTKNIHDDGHRRIFCTINAGKNIKIEDELYDKYYGYK